MSRGLASEASDADAAARTAGAALPLGGTLWIALAVLIWAAYPAATRLGLGDALGPADLLALRFGVSAAIFLPFLLRAVDGLPREAWTRGLALALCQGALTALVIAGLALAPASHATALVQGMGPAWMLLFGALCLGWRGGPISAIGAACAAAAALLFVLSASRDLDPWVLRGDLFFLAASVLACGYVVMIKRFALPAGVAAALVAVYCAIAFLPWYAQFGGAGLARAAWGELAFQAFYQGVLTGCVSFVALNRAIAALGSARTSAALAVVPAIAAVVAIPLLGELPNALETLAIALATAGVWLAARTGAPARATAVRALRTLERDHVGLPPAWRRAGLSRTPTGSGR